jgi:dihydroorotase-like cyclic amidohydrolase
VSATLIRNGRVITATDDYVADVLMQGGVVRACTCCPAAWTSTCTWRT